MSDQHSPGRNPYGYHHDTGPGPPYDEEADQAAEHSYTAAYAYTDGSVIRSIPVTSAPWAADSSTLSYGQATQLQQAQSTTSTF